MANKDDGEKAIQELNDSEVDGRNIRVNFARPRRE
jgi:RNA recognition motif-containing protein